MVLKTYKYVTIEREKRSWGESLFQMYSNFILSCGRKKKKRPGMYYMYKVSIYHVLSFKSLIDYIKPLQTGARKLGRLVTLHSKYINLANSD